MFFFCKWMSVLKHTNVFHQKEQLSLNLKKCAMKTGPLQNCSVHFAARIAVDVEPSIQEFYSLGQFLPPELF